MGFIFNGIAGSEVTITGSVSTATPIPSTTNAVVNTAFTTTGAAQDAYTVPAGYTFHLMGICCQTVGNRTLTIYKNDGATAVFGVYQEANGAGWFGDSYRFSSICPIWSYTAAQVVKVNGTNGVPWNIWGILEAV